jgi:ubiquinone biosynthesis O-methyltransferase
MTKRQVMMMMLLHQRQREVVASRVSASSLTYWRSFRRGHQTDATVSSSSSLRGQVDARERAKFEADAALWWNENEGPFAALHAMNPVRVRFIRDVLTGAQGLMESGVSRRERNVASALRGMSICDVGCGGGILAESLARLGAKVTAIDAGVANIEIARAHAALDPALKENLTYEAITAEELVERGAQFDVVTSLEVIEHVTDPLEFTKSIAQLVKPNGSLFISTINRTARSFGMAILAAERVLGIVPAGTHEFSKFLTPGEIAMLARRGGCEMKELAGMVFHPLRNEWSLSSDTQVNFIARCVKKPPE